MTAIVAKTPYVTFSPRRVVRVMVLRAVRWAARWVFLATGSSRAANVGGVPTEDLITRYQGGQPRAFEALYDRYKNYVYRTAFYVLRHREEAEEATQEAFLDVLKALPNYDVNGPARFETWLYRVTVNRCKMRLRRKKLPSVEWDDIGERLERLPVANSERPEATLLKQERARALWDAVNALPEQHRLTVMLRYQHDLSYEEIANILGVKLGTVKSRLYNAHKKLKKLLET